MYKMIGSFFVLFLLGCRSKKIRAKKRQSHIKQALMEQYSFFWEKAEKNLMG